MPLAEKLPQMVAEGDTARARLDDPETSHQAADSNTNLDAVKEHVLSLLRVRPLTDHELTVAYSKDDHPAADFDSPRKRRSDLTKTGLVLATTERRSGRSGRPVTVWRIRPDV